MIRSIYVKKKSGKYNCVSSEYTLKNQTESTARVNKRMTSVLHHSFVFLERDYKILLSDYTSTHHAENHLKIFLTRLDKYMSEHHQAVLSFETFIENNDEIN